MKVLITGAAGFIGYHLAKKLLIKNIKVIGIDNINDYYDVKLKNNRIKELKKNNKFFFYKLDLCNYKKLNNLVKKKIYHNFKTYKQPKKQTQFSYTK